MTKELAHFDMDIAALSATRCAGEEQLTDDGVFALCKPYYAIVMKKY